jgi:hypothetical protein
MKAVPKWKCQIDITSGLDWKHILFTTMANKNVMYQKDLIMSRKK